MTSEKSNMLRTVWRTVLPLTVRDRIYTLRSSIWSPIKYRRDVSKMVETVTPVAVSDDKEFVEYVRDQIDRSYRLSQWSVTHPEFLHERVVYLVGMMEPFLPTDRTPLSVLCVGCRDNKELDYIQQHCNVGTVTGLDLFSVDERIKVGDMHKMPFDAQQFDVLYSCCSLEHAYDIHKALGEFARVTKPGGLLVIEIPIEYPTNVHDRWDLKSSGALIEAMGSSVAEVLATEDDPPKHRARVVVRRSVS
jgi:SAM-dependent methyltransferase